MGALPEGFGVALARGDFDEELQYLKSAVQLREKRLRDARAVEMRAELAVGDTVRFTESTTPKYLRGLVATVEKIGSKQATVTITDAWRAKRYGGHSIRAPYSIIEVVARSTWGLDH